MLPVSLIAFFLFILISQRLSLKSQNFKVFSCKIFFLLLSVFIFLLPGFKKNMPGGLRVSFTELKKVSGQRSQWKSLGSGDFLAV